jgi:hypothetical protein
MDPQDSPAPTPLIMSRFFFLQVESRSNEIKALEDEVELHRQQQSVLAEENGDLRQVH